MSKDIHNNERFLKEKADKYRPVPPPLVWNEIEQVLDKDKGKRRSFLILWIFGAIVMGTTIFINLKVNTEKESPIAQQEIITNDYQKQSDQNPQDIRSVDSEALNEVKQEKNVNSSEAKLSISQNKEGEAINEVKQRQNANSSETIITVSDNQDWSKVDFKKLKSFVTREHQLNSLNISGTDRSLDENTINSDARAIVTEEDNLRPRMSTQSTQSTLEDLKIIQVTPLQRLKWIRKPIVSNITLSDPSEKLTAILIPESKANLLRFSPWFVELGGGIGRNLSNPVLIDPTLGGFRLNTENSWYSWSTSIQFGYQFDKLWYTAMGFDLNQTKNRFDFWRRNISNLVVSENQSFQISNSDFFSIGEIRHTFLDVGLSLGRRVNIDKWHFSLEGGAIFNVLFDANGKVQVGGLEFSRLEDQEEYFNTQIGIGARLSAMLDYPISDQLWISVGPNYHQYFNTVSSDENSLEERNSILQIKTKVRWCF